MGNGIVFSSQFIEKDEATSSMLSNIKGKITRDPRSFSFTPGRRKKAWNKNCVAVGLASGFLEPLESTSIALVETAIEKIAEFIADESFGQEDINKFNYAMGQEYERVRDFIILHYKLNGRTDSPMWQHCRDLAIPDSLSEKMLAFKREGKLTRLPWEIFGNDSWLAIYNGLNYMPDSYDQSIDKFDVQFLSERLIEMRSFIHSTVRAAPTHSEFLKQNCSYNQ